LSFVSLETVPSKDSMIHIKSLNLLRKLHVTCMTTRLSLDELVTFNIVATTLLIWCDKSMMVTLEYGASLT